MASTSTPPHHYGLILAGGRGTRFWPRSRRRSAKQVLNVVGSRSLIQGTVDRLRPVIDPERLWVLTNDYLRDEIVRQLPEVPAAQILAEPAQRNTAPAIGLAACILQSIDPDAVMGVFPADHIIAKEGRYRQLVRGAFRAAERGQMVVLGILPRWPETGYGYIEFPRGTEPGSKPVAIRRFHEKPLLLERRDVLRARERAARRAAQEPAAHRKYPGRIAGFPRCQVRGQAGRGIPAVREHFDRFRGDGESARRGRHRMSRDRLERRGKLERRL
jgi:hypothetical protein